jgi:hypothetical protein
MAKRRRTAAKASSSTSPRAASASLDRMIDTKERAVGDGSRQVIIAIAMVTNLVTIDLTKTPPKVVPANLGTLTFNDPKVGMSNGQMPIFKGNLAALLPEISADIARIPDNAGLQIGKVADFVRLSLLAV